MISLGELLGQIAYDGVSSSHGWSGIIISIPRMLMLVVMSGGFNYWLTIEKSFVFERVFIAVDITVPVAVRIGSGYTLLEYLF